MRFFCCAVINYAVLLLWYLVFIFAREPRIHVWSRQFHLSAEQFDFLIFAGMTFLKILILVFNLVPFIALLVVGRASSGGAAAESSLKGESNK